MNITSLSVGGNQYEIEDKNARSMISKNEFSTGKAYATGEYCIYENKLYKFTSVKDAGPWDSSKVVETSVEEICSQLNSSLEKLDKGDFRHTLRFESLDALNNIQVENNAINICRANIAGSGWCTVITGNIDNVLLVQLIFSGTSVKTRNCELSNRTWTDFSDH